MAVDSIKGIQHYQITPASDTQNRKQSQHDRSNDEQASSGEEEKNEKPAPQPTSSGGELGQILDTSTVVELLNHRPKPPVSIGKNKTPYRKKSAPSKP